MKNFPWNNRWDTLFSDGWGVQNESEAELDGELRPSSSRDSVREPTASTPEVE